MSRGAPPIKPPPASGRGASTFDPLAEGATAVSDKDEFDPLKEGAVAAGMGRVAATPELDAIRTQQKAKYPSAQERGPSPGVMSAGAKGLLEGIGVDPSHPVTGTIKNIVQGVKGAGEAYGYLTSPRAIYDVATKPGEAASKASDVAAGIVHMPSELAQGLYDLDPERVAYGLMGTAAQVGSMFLGGKGAQTLAERNALEGAAGAAGITPRMSSAAANMIESGVKADMVNDYAKATIPIWRQAAGELGVSAEDFPKRGVTNVGKEAVTNAGKKAIDVADHAVDITNRPFLDALDKVGDVSTHPPGLAPGTSVKERIIANLRSQARAEAINKPLADAFNTAADLVEKNGNTFRDLQDLKVLSNKKAAALMSKNIGAQINASAEASYAWRALGDSIRAEMYPALQDLTGIDLSHAGRLEAMVMDARDGLYQHYYKDVLNPHNARVAQSYLEYVAEGSQRNRSLLKRAMMLERTPAGQFNARFGNVIGAPPMPSSVPYYPGRANIVEPGVPAPRTIAGAQSDLLPTGIPNAQPLLAPPPGHSQGIGEALFKMQQRVRKEAEAAPPVTLRGEQGELMRTTPITSEPGISQPKGATLEEQYKIKLARQKAAKEAEAKLFPPDKPGTQYSLERGMAPKVMGIITSDQAARTAIKDLRYRLGQLEDFMSANPNSKDESILREMRTIRNEIKRRKTSLP